MYFHISLPHIQRQANLVVEQPMLCEQDLSNLKSGREYLAQLEERLVELFQQGYAISALLDYRTHYVDELMCKLFAQYELDRSADLCLVAVGGYGRAELFLKSDIDLLLVSRTTISPDMEESISGFISYLWDLKLDIGSSVRTIAETIENANADLTVRTNLLENRYLCGNEAVYHELLATIDAECTWNTKRFFHAKVAEELERHHSYKDTAYALEPDLKNNPGGLRDIQVMQWIANFHFKAKTVEDMLKLNFLSQEEYEELIECRDVLFQVRYALHVVNRREDNRLLLDHQPSVAKLLGYTGEGNRPVENMMRDLFRIVRRVRELNSMTLQLEVLRITDNIGDQDIQFLDNGFIRRGPLIDLADDTMFDTTPMKLLEIFLVMSKHNDVVGLHVSCLRRLREARRSLHTYLVEIPDCRQTFKRILENPKAAFLALPLLHEHHLLSAYMPSWEKIEGLSQFDMFHTFTVDEHTIRVIKNFEELNESQEQIHSLFKHVYQQIPNIEILIVAALLHDIAKGQGGHHAQLGAGEALYFCQLHKYSIYQTRIITWLIYNHLLMSSTALRRDVNDPQVVNEFCKQVQDEDHLNLLYCLSVADINATNNHEWNSWKDQVFRQLYFAARQALRQGSGMPVDTHMHAHENQEQALAYLKGEVREQDARMYWAAFQTNYFLYYTPIELAWHARNILHIRDDSRPLILFAQHELTCTTEVLIFDKHRETAFNFGAIASVMAKKRLNVQSAQFIENNLHHSLSTIKFQNQKGTNLDNDRLHSLRLALYEGLNEQPSLADLDDLNDTSNKKIFRLPTVITYFEDPLKKSTHLEISTLDRPGLLARIGITFGQLNYFVRSARITTTGERADDFFAITDKQGRPLSERQKDKLAKALYAALDDKDKDKDGAKGKK